MEPDPSLHRFEEGVRFDRAFVKLEATCSIPRVGQVLDSYKRQMSRVSDLGELPVILVFFAGLFAGFKHRALDQVRDEGVKLPFDGPLVAAYMKRQFDLWHTSSPDDLLASEVRNDGAHNLAGLIGASTGTVAPGIEATLASMLSDAWSAFEILAGDLWIEAVNASPGRLATKAGANKQIPVKKLAEMGFDLRTEMGRVLVESGRVDFLSLRHIQEAYSTIFDGADAGQSSRVFSSYKLLDAVGQVRHCFAHRGGVVDRRALDAVRLLPGLESLAVGDLIRLTGPVTRDCISVTTKCSADLFRFVDGWLARNVSRSDMPPAAAATEGM